MASIFFGKIFIMGAKSKFVEVKRPKIMFERFDLLYHLKELLFVFNKKEHNYTCVVIYI